MKTLLPLAALVLLSLPTLCRAADPAAPAPFEKDIRAFEEADANSPPPKDAALFIGSSSIRLWTTLRDDFPNLKAINRGFGGSQIEHSVRYADRIVLPCRPKVIVFYAGDNDIAAGKSPQRVLEDFTSFAGKVHAALPDTRILYLSVKPSLARWHLHGRIWLANQLVRELAVAHELIEYVDVFTPALTPGGAPRRDLLVADGLHLNADGYRVWAAALRPHLDRAPAGK